jgi:hypothetical protein
MVTAKKAAPKLKKVREPVFKVCEVCEKAFRIPPNRAETARWCSRACQRKSVVFRKECSDAQAGEKSWRWTGKYIHGDGYVRLTKEHKQYKCVRSEHVVIMLDWMMEVEPDNPFLVIASDGRVHLHPNVVVHHIDRVRNNNARSNLLAVTVDAHNKIHHHGRKPESWECWPRNPTAW